MTERNVTDHLNYLADMYDRNPPVILNLLNYWGGRLDFIRKVQQKQAKK